MATEKTYETSAPRRRKGQTRPEQLSGQVAADLQSEFARIMTEASSLAEGAGLQSESARRQMEGFLTQANKISDFYREIAREAFRPVDAKFRKQTSRSVDDQDPTDEQWQDVKALALKQASDSLPSPQEHLAYVRQQIAEALIAHVD